jgi:hypothetical protein
VIHQPSKLKFDGVTYTRVSPLKVVSDTISEGPFYKRPGVDPRDWAYLPDAGFLATGSGPTFMHCIQQRATPRTPHP